MPTPTGVVSVKGGCALPYTVADEENTTCLTPYARAAARTVTSPFRLFS